jgi:hypothetical protein
VAKVGMSRKAWLLPQQQHVQLVSLWQGISAGIASIAQQALHKHLQLRGRAAGRCPQQLESMCACIAVQFFPTQHVVLRTRCSKATIQLVGYALSSASEHIKVRHGSCSCIGTACTKLFGLAGTLPCSGLLPGLCWWWCALCCFKHRSACPTAPVVANWHDCRQQQRHVYVPCPMSARSCRSPAHSSSGSWPTAQTLRPACHALRDRCCRCARCPPPLC